MSGMVFVSKGFPVDSQGYNAMVAFVATVVIVSTVAFILFVAFEVRAIGQCVCCMYALFNKGANAGLVGVWGQAHVTSPRPWPWRTSLGGPIVHFV